MSNNILLSKSSKISDRGLPLPNSISSSETIKKEKKKRKKTRKNKSLIG